MCINDSPPSRLLRSNVVCGLRPRQQFPLKQSQEFAIHGCSVNSLPASLPISNSSCDDKDDEGWEPDQ